MLGSPTAHRTGLTTGDRSLTISRLMTALGTVYLHEVRINGEVPDRMWLRYDEVLGGGRLDLRLGPDPTRFRPPSLTPDEE